jgi:hypothetical protein
VKLSKAHFHRRVYKIPELHFEDQRLSSFSGVILLQALFAKLDLRNKLKRCFQHIHSSAVVGFPVVTLMLIVHLMLGYRRLREMERYKEDPLVLRALGLRRLPDVATVSRRLSQVDKESIREVRALNRVLSARVREPLTIEG